MMWRESPRSKPGKLGVVSIRFADTRTNVERFVKEWPKTFVYQLHTTKTGGVALAFKVNATPTYCYWTFEEASLVHRGGGRLYAVYTAL